MEQNTIVIHCDEPGLKYSEKSEADNSFFSNIKKAFKNTFTYDDQLEDGVDRKGKLVFKMDKIASGGMSTLYKTRHPFLKRDIVIKELSKKFLLDDVMIERFTREAITLANMGHQNIINVYDFWKTKNNCYIVMEYIEGQDLNKLLQNRGKLSTAQALNIGIQALRGLCYSHKKNIIHRDLKPQNIMIAKDGNVKIMDFGIAIKDDYKNLTSPGSLIGTPCYMSPEQVVGDKITPLTDIFSFGVVMYELLTGVLPFKENSEKVGLFNKILSEKHTSIRKLNKNVPRPVCKIINKCLAKEPEKRYQSSYELLTALEKRFKRTFNDRDICDELMELLRDVKPDPHNVTQKETEQKTRVLGKPNNPNATPEFKFNFQFRPPRVGTRFLAPICGVIGFTLALLLNSQYLL